jgi:hypothetical protein
MHTGKILGLFVGALALLGSEESAKAATTNCEVLLRNVPASSETLVTTCQHLSTTGTVARFDIQNFGATQSLSVTMTQAAGGTSGKIIGLNNAGAVICQVTAPPGGGRTVNCNGAAFWRAVISYVN